MHVVQAGGEEERRTLAFWDYRARTPRLHREYEELKRRLARQYSAAQFSLRQAYTEGKRDFIKRIVERALAEGHPHGI